MRDSDLDAAITQSLEVGPRPACGPAPAPAPPKAGGCAHGPRAAERFQANEPRAEGRGVSD
jgi:hypothetical protein